MANSYATVPAIIPGDLQVKGNLTVSGPNLTFGRFPRKYRLQEQLNGQFLETVNIDYLNHIQDDASIASTMRVTGVTGVPFAVATQALGVPGTDNYLLQQGGGALQVLVQELRVGSTTPYVRLFNAPPAGAYQSVNVQADGATRDDTTRAGYYQSFDTNQKTVMDRLYDAAGNSTITTRRRMFWVDESTHHMVGTAGAMTIGTHPIYGNILGAHGLIRLRVTGAWNVTAAGQGGLGINWGGTWAAAITISASTAFNYIAEMMLFNQGVTNQQAFHSVVNYGTAIANVTGQTFTVDSTANQVLYLQCIMPDTTSSLDTHSIEVELVTLTTSM